MKRKYDNLERMRKDIARDKEKVERLLEQIRLKEEKLREAEAARVVADVEAMKLSPEQIGALLDMIENGQIRLMKSGGVGIKAYATKMAARNEKEDTLSEDMKKGEGNQEDSEDE